MCKALARRLGQGALRRFNATTGFPSSLSSRTRPQAAAVRAKAMSTRSACRTQLRSVPLRWPPRRTTLGVAPGQLRPSTRSRPRSRRSRPAPRGMLALVVSRGCGRQRMRGFRFAMAPFSQELEPGNHGPVHYRTAATGCSACSATSTVSPGCNSASTSALIFEARPSTTRMISILGWLSTPRTSCDFTMPV